MPELPEVETVRRGLEKQIVGKTIESVKVTYPKLVRTGLEDFQLLLPGQSVQAMRRQGKYLIFELTGGLVISHLRMEGKYFLFSDQVPTNKHFHAFFTFTDGTTLVYQDVRKFGTMEYLPKSQEAAYFLSKKLGPEPTKETFKLAPFERTLVKSHRPIKSYLLDQSLVAGLGNIYADVTAIFGLPRFILKDAQIACGQPKSSGCMTRLSGFYKRASSMVVRPFAPIRIPWEKMAPCRTFCKFMGVRESFAPAVGQLLKKSK